MLFIGVLLAGSNEKMTIKTEKWPSNEIFKQLIFPALCNNWLKQIADQQGEGQRLTLKAVQKFPNERKSIFVLEISSHYFSYAEKKKKKPKTTLQNL